MNLAALLPAALLRAARRRARPSRHEVMPMPATADTEPLTTRDRVFERLRMHCDGADLAQRQRGFDPPTIEERIDAIVGLAHALARRPIEPLTELRALAINTEVVAILEQLHDAAVKEAAAREADERG